MSDNNRLDLRTVYQTHISLSDLESSSITDVRILEHLEEYSFVIEASSEPDETSFSSNLSLGIYTLLSMSRNSEYGRWKSVDESKWKSQQKELLKDDYRTAVTGHHDSWRQDLLCIMMYRATRCSSRVSSSSCNHYLQKLTSAPSVNKVEALSNSLYVFQFLKSFCLSEDVTKNCAAMMLAVILMFPKHRADSIKLSSLIATARIHDSSDVEEKYYKRLFRCVSQCITLSCCDEDIAFLLCSEFFELKILCNLVKIHLLNIRKVIESMKSDSKVFARLIIEQNSKVFFLWLAAIWTSQASKFLNSALRSMSSISLSVMSWTRALQSFIQVDYHSISNRNEFISRAQKFSAIYFVRSDAIISFTSSSSFEEIMISNISLDIKRHLLHDHTSIQSTTYWIFEIDELHSAQKKLKRIDHLILQLSSIDRASSDHSFKAKWVTSCDAWRTLLILQQSCRRRCQ